LVDGEIIAHGIVEQAEHAFRLRAGGEQLHGELVSHAQPRDILRIDAIGFVHRLAVLALDHECLRQVEADAQHAGTIGAAGSGEGRDQLPEEALGGSAIARAN
jgi:hypothetical protein